MHRMGMTPKTTEAQSYLNLTDAQVTSLQQLRQAEMTALKPIFQQIAPLRDSLRTQTQSGSADAAAIGKLVLNIQALEQQISTTRSSYHDQALALLTAEQKTKLAALQSAADLMPTIHQAMGLNLLNSPKGGPGGMGPGAMGPEGFHGPPPGQE
jgi:Spy/CpxP family protein refolding chaperone